MQSSPDYIDPVILLELARGSQQAFIIVFEQYKDKLYTVALKLTRSPDLAQEVVQEVFLKVWLRRRQLSTIDNFPAYLFTIARNQVFDWLKKTAREEAEQLAWGLVLPVQENMTENHLMEREYEQVMREAVKQLPPQQQEVYQLVKVQGLKREDAALQLNLSPETVKSHLAKAMRTVRAYCLQRVYGVPLVVAACLLSSQ